MPSTASPYTLGAGLPAKLGNGPRTSYDVARVGAGLGRGPNQRMKLTAAAWSNTWPAPGATLDLDFVNNRGYVRGVGQGGVMDAITFTRASSGNWVGSDGLLKTGAGTFTGTENAEGKNLLTFPQDFDNAAWVKIQSTVVANQEIAPDGTNTADKLRDDLTPNATHFAARVQTTVAASYTFSVYAKKAERSHVMLYHLQSNVGAIFNLDTGAITTPTGIPLATASVTNEGNGWWRCLITLTATAASNTFRIYLASNSTTFTYNGDGTSGLYIWGAQLEVGSTATTYYPTNINVPRFDWASTTQVANKNLISFTEDFSSGVWISVGSGVTVSTNTTNDPNGNLTADTVSGNSGVGLQQIGGAATIGVSYTFSVWAKANASSRCTLTLLFSGGGLGLTSTINNLTSNWQRFSVTATAPVGSDSVRCRVIITDTGSIDIWGAQLEAGSSATAYQAISVPTTNTPLAANTTSNGLLIEESRTNRILWCRDATSGTGTNLLTFSEQFNNAAWVAYNAGVTADAVNAPNATLTADKIVEASGSALQSRYATYAATITSTHTASVYAKSAERTFLRLSVSGSGSAQWYGATFDLQNGTITQQNAGASGTVSGATIVDAGNGWYRCSVTGLTGASSANSYVYVGPATTGTPTAGTFGVLTYTGDGTSGIYTWGAQLVPGSVLTDYQVTTTAALFGWSKSNVTLAKDQTGVDGVANAATKITASAANAVLMQPIVLASGSRTCSVYLKRITGTGNVQVSLDGSTWSTVDLSSTEWRRIVLSGTVTNPVVGIRLATNGDAVAMDYAQVEDGAFATSPILTTTASVTRSADLATMSGQNFITWYSTDRGTIYADVNAPDNLTKRVLSFSGGPNPRLIDIYTLPSPNCFVYYTNINDSQNDILPRGGIGSAKLVVAYGYSGTVGSQNGSSALVGTTVSAAIVGLQVNRIEIGARNLSSQLNGTIKKISYFPKQLTNNALQVLSGPAT